MQDPDSGRAWLALLAYVLAAISGGLGGCGAASHAYLRSTSKQSMRAAYFMSYGVIGAVAGVIMLGFFLSFGPESRLDSVIAPSALAGFSVAAVLAAGNISARAVLRRLGIVVEVTVRDRKSGD